MVPTGTCGDCDRPSSGACLVCLVYSRAQLPWCVFGSRHSVSGSQLGAVGGSAGGPCHSGCGHQQDSVFSVTALLSLLSKAYACNHAWLIATAPSGLHMQFQHQPCLKQHHCVTSPRAVASTPTHGTPHMESLSPGALLNTKRAVLANHTTHISYRPPCSPLCMLLRL